MGLKDTVELQPHVELGRLEGVEQLAEPTS